MPNGFSQMGGIPEGYDSLLNSARQQLVRMPDGTLQLAPQFGGSTSLDAIYGGIVPSSPGPMTGPTTRTVQTMPVSGKPNGGSAFAGGWGSTGFVLPGMNAPTQTAMLPYPPDSPPPVPGPSQFALMNQRDRIENKPAPQIAQAPTTIDAANALDMSYYGLSRPATGGSNSALDAIDQLTGSGRSTAMPFPLMAFNRPRYAATESAPDPGNLGLGNAPGFGPHWGTLGNLKDIAAGMYDAPQGGVIDITVNGGTPEAGTAFNGGWGSTGFVLPGMNATPSVPPPRARPNPPSPSNYTIKSGDTLGALAKRFGTTVNQLANANGISNPNRIRAGATLNLGYLAPPVPRMPPAALGRGYGKPKETRAERFTNLDEFGMIR